MRGFCNPEIHDVTNITAQIVALDGGSYIGLYLWQDEAPLVVHRGVPVGLPEVQIFGGAEMADKFARLEKAVNEIFGPSATDRAPHLGSVDMFQGARTPPVHDSLASDAPDDMGD